MLLKNKNLQKILSEKWKSKRKIDEFFFHHIRFYIMILQNARTFGGR
jgi:hypothetical protein